jgi:hypothetical protein
MAMAVWIRVKGILSCIQVGVHGVLIIKKVPLTFAKCVLSYVEKLQKYCCPPPPTVEVAKLTGYGFYEQSFKFSSNS